MQSYQDFEMLVIDDGSTDHTAQVIQSFYDNRIRYIRLDKNQGVNAARNIGVSIARGEWILFVDSDDELLPDGLKTVAAYTSILGAEADVGVIGFLALKEPQGMVQGYRSYECAWEQVVIPREDIVLKKRFTGDMFWTVRRTVFTGGLSFPDWINGFERLFWSRVSKHWKILAVNRVIGVIHFEPGESHLSIESWKRWPRAFAQGYETFIRENFDILMRNPEQLLAFAKQTAKCYWRAGHFFKSAGWAYRALWYRLVLSIPLLQAKGGIRL